jgi:hypothetical protein
MHWIYGRNGSTVKNSDSALLIGEFHKTICGINNTSSIGNTQSFYYISFNLDTTTKLRA